MDFESHDLAGRGVDGVGSGFHGARNWFRQILWIFSPHHFASG